MNEDPNKRFPGFIEMMYRTLSENREGLERLMSAVTNGLSQLTPQIQQFNDIWKNIHPALSELAIGLANLPEKYKKAVLLVANEGWYIDPDEMAFDQPARIANAYEKGRHQEAEEQLIEHYRARLGEIENVLSAQFPKRAPIFKNAFEAHRQGLYFASIPTLLAQVDGVCLDITSHYLFQRGRGEERTGIAPYVDRFAIEPLSQAMLAPFLEPHSITLTSKQRVPGFSKLNRHMVLHGESLDYGTEANSLRAVSLLYYAVRALTEYGDVKAANKTQE